MRRVSSYFQPLPCKPKPVKHLYLLKCEITGLYKIGKTSGDIRVRINKLYSNSHAFQRSIKTVKVWEKRGFCEYYILQCFEKLRTSHPFIPTDIQNGLSTQVMNPVLFRLLNLLFPIYQMRRYENHTTIFQHHGARLWCGWYI